MGEDLHLPTGQDGQRCQELLEHPPEAARQAATCDSPQPDQQHQDRSSNTKAPASSLESASAMMNAACNDMTLCQKMFRSWMRKRMKPGGYLSICLVFWLYYVASYIVLNNISGCMNMM